jgi:quercetin dioxygenase-like cupin family protein
MKKAALLVLSLGLFTSLPASSQEPGHEGHTMVLPNKVEWKDAPAALPSGAKAAVLEGDPTKPGPFTLRLKMPKGYKIPPHTHPAIEHVTVVQGSLQMGLGDKWDDKAMTDIPAGGFAIMQVGTKHFAGSKGGATVQIHGIGPWGITYVNPADDPRNKAAQK